MPHFRGVAAALIAVLLVALTIARLWHPSLNSYSVGIASADVPTVVAGDMSHGDRPLESDEYIQKALPGAHILSRLYGQGEGPIDFLLLSGTAGVALHDPRLCLSSWQLSSGQTERLPGTPIVMQTFEGAKTQGVPTVFIAYFYVVNGKIISDSTTIRTTMMESALLGRQSAPVYFFRFVQPLGADPATTQRLHAHLDQFATEMWHSVQPRLAAPDDARKS